MSTCWSGQPDYVERLEAENAKLRAALVEIAEMDEAYRMTDPFATAQHIATKALTNEQDK